MIFCLLLAGKLSEDDLNALIAHAHRRIDQLNRELAEQRVSEQIHIDAALEQQKLQHQKTLEKTVNTALQHVREETRLEQERKVEGRFIPFILQKLSNSIRMYFLLLSLVWLELCLCV